MRASEERALDERLLGGGGGRAGGGDEASGAAWAPGNEFSGGNHAPDGRRRVTQGGCGFCDGDAARGFESAGRGDGHGVIVAQVCISVRG